MKPLFFSVMSVFILACFLASCTPSNCNCTSIWNNTDTYYTGDQRSHSGTCYTAVHQNSNVEPGPWMVNGNDSWEECH